MGQALKEKSLPMEPRQAKEMARFIKSHWPDCF
jgi:hypothetical protein